MLMRHYPLFLDLADRAVLVVGAGTVGRRKIVSLLQYSPREVLVVDPGLTPAAMRELTDSGPVRCRAGAFAPDDLDGKFLAFAATNLRDVNSLLASLCRERNILCNIADAPGESDFLVPAHFSVNGLTVALSTAGHSPALARHLRTELEAWVGMRYAGLLTVLGRLRPLVLALGLPTEENSALFRSIIRSSLAVLLEQRRYTAAAALLTKLLPQPLHAHREELLHGL